MNNKTITNFFSTQYVAFSSYDNLRKIASLVDGQKNAARKVLYTVLEKNIKDKLKVSQLGSKASEFAEYLHGNMDGVIVNLAQDFTGTNNIPLLQRRGNFGTRFSPEASASRYIFTHGTTEFFQLFKKEDSDILRKQYFEGTQIEPVFYVPTLPIILINGSEGVSTGFAQKILPRDPHEIRKIIKSRLSGRNSNIKMIPYYKGFNGVIEQGDNSAQWLIKGVFDKIAANKIRITEVPIGYDLTGYLKVLDDLEDKKIIQSYRDKSEDDKFLFEVTIPSKSLTQWGHDQTLVMLKLVKKVTENYTVIDQDNKIAVCKDADEILNRFIEVKLGFMSKRKDNSVKFLAESIEYDYSKYIFIKSIVDEKLVISKRKKDAIIKDLEKIKGIIPRDGSYDYLLNMSILSLTEERMKKLDADIKASKAFLVELKKTSVEELWLADL